MTLLLLSLLLACPASDEAVQEPVPVAATVEVDAGLARVTEGLVAAQRLHQDGDRAACATQIRKTYVVDFQPLVPVLRAHDTAGTLALEVAFGEAQRQAERRRGKPDLAGLITQVTAAVEALPRAPVVEEAAAGGAAASGAAAAGADGG